MKVKDLIKVLEQQDQEMEVAIDTSGEYWSAWHIMTEDDLSIMSIGYQVRDETIFGAYRTELTTRRVLCIGEPYAAEYDMLHRDSEEKPK